MNKNDILSRIANHDPNLILVTTANGCTFAYEREGDIQEELENNTVNKQSEELLKGCSI